MFLFILTAVVTISSVLSQQSYVKFSKSAFTGTCNTQNEITSISASDPFVVLYFCVYISQIPAGAYHETFYDSQSNKVYQFNDIQFQGGGSGTIKGYITLSFLTDGYQGTQVYTLKIQNTNLNTFASGSITVTNIVYVPPGGPGPFVADIGIRYNKPSKWLEFFSTSDGSYGDNSVIKVSSSSQMLYFCTVVYNAVNGYMLQFQLKGLSSNKQYTGTLQTISLNTQGKYQYGYCETSSLKLFREGENIKVTVYYYGKSNNELDHKSIQFKYSIGDEDTTTEEPVNNGHCEEKPGKSKSACQYQQNQNDCEKYNKCRWVA